VRQQRPLEPLPGDDLISPASDGEAISMSQEIAATVSRALADLPEPLREVLVLRHYENMNFEEIGRLLNVPASTLKSRFGTALRKLRARLRELGITGWESDE
jgi:RNA polymerase sigma-70 factor (ECF subfamily)